MSDTLKYPLLFIAVVVLDQASKWLILPYKESPIGVTRFLTFSVDTNRGISWGLFNTTNTWLFVVITLIIGLLTLSLCVYAYQQYKQGNTIYGELLVIAGSVSNIIDRVVHAGVIDFIAIHFGSYTWPVFNLADVAIVLGVFIMFIQHIVLPHKEVISDA